MYETFRLDNSNILYLVSSSWLHYTGCHTNDEDCEGEPDEDITDLFGCCSAVSNNMASFRSEDGDCFSLSGRLNNLI